MILETYPSDTSNFLKKQKNCFANPVGYNISQGINGIFDELLNEADTDTDKVSPFLDNIIRIKAVQDFSPSQAMSFIFLLKKAIRESLGNKIHETHISEELLLFESKIDDLALLSFDIYMKCREKIYELKSNEVRSMTFRLLQRANLICEIQDQEQDSGPETVLTQNIKG
jgi:hypothetical protein